MYLILENFQIKWCQFNTQIRVCQMYFILEKYLLCWQLITLFYPVPENPCRYYPVLWQSLRSQKVPNEETWFYGTNGIPKLKKYFKPFTSDKTLLDHMLQTGVTEYEPLFGKAVRQSLPHDLSLFTYEQYKNSLSQTNTTTAADVVSPIVGSRRFPVSSWIAVR